MRGRIAPLLPVLLLGVAAVPNPAHTAALFVPLSEATAMHVCPRCDGRPQALSSRPRVPQPLPSPSRYRPLAPARWVGTPHGPGPFPPKPPALS
jgi:hypothetical protein